MKYHVLVTKTLDVPKNLYHQVITSEEEAKKVAQAKLLELEGDVAIVTKVAYGETKVVHRFEAVRKAS